MYLNKVQLIGRLGKDPEVKGRDGGFVTFSVATEKSWKDKNGDRQKKTQWHNVVIFNTAAVNFAKNYVKKGSLVYVEGELETREYEANDGSTRRVTEIVVPAFTGVLMAHKERDDDGGGRSSGGREEREERRPTTPSKSLSDDIDDDIPF